MIRPLILITVLALAACGRPTESQPTVPVAAATEGALPADAPGAAPAWTVSAEGVGPITADTAFSRDAIAALFPDSEVKAAFINLEGEPYPVVTVFGPDELSIEVLQGTTKGRINSILAQGGPVVGPRGEKLMDPFSGLGLKASDCVIGADRAYGAALCRRPGTATPAYVIGARGGLTGNVGDTPDAAELAKGFLREFLWQAPLK